MTYTTWTNDDVDMLNARAPRRGGLRLGVFGISFIGLGAVAAATVVATWGQPWITFKPAQTTPTAEVAAPAAPRPLMLAAADTLLADIGYLPSSGAVAARPRGIFETTIDAALTPSVASAMPEPASPMYSQDVAKRIPLPSANPLFALRIQPGDDADRAALKEPGQAIAIPPLPLRNPLLGPNRQVAELPPANRPLGEPAAPALTPSGQAALPGPGDRFALYDIKAKVVYMPNGDKLEAHSGYGEMFDDPTHISKKMVGPTPPNAYELSRREALFHGVEALRMKPVGGSPMYGRDGFLTHSYMLGPRGDSNGCVSFRDYPKFLEAFKRGEVTRLVVVTSLPTVPQPANPLLSWLLPKNQPERQ